MRLAVGPGDQLVFEFDEDGLLRVAPVRKPLRKTARGTQYRASLRVAPVRKPLLPLRGFLAKDTAGARMDCEQIDEAIRQRMRRKYGSSS